MSRYTKYLWYHFRFTNNPSLASHHTMKVCRNAYPHCNALIQLQDYQTLRRRHSITLGRRQCHRILWSLGIVLSLFRLCQAWQSSSLPPPARLRQLLQSEMDGTRQSDSPILLPCCYDGLTARLVARYQRPDTDTTAASSQHRFEATFLTGFGAAASYGIPDTQLISYQEMLHTCSVVSEALASVALEQPSLQHPIPCIAVRLPCFTVQTL